MVSSTLTNKNPSIERKDFPMRETQPLNRQKSLIKVYFQARKRNPNPNFLIRIFSSGVGVFHVKGWGPKSSVCPSKPGKIKLFGRDIPGFCRDITAVPEKLEKKCLCSISIPYTLGDSRATFPDALARKVIVFGLGVGHRGIAVLPEKGVQNEHSRLSKMAAPSPSLSTLKTVTSLNKEARLLKFHFPKR